MKVIPLGGLGEFGSNLMVYELADSAIVVDCGMMFPDPSVLGVDVLIPDLGYLEKIRDKVAAVFLTHAHEDHIGALPFLNALLDVPVYGLPLTLGFARDKLNEFRSEKTNLRPMKPRKTVEAGSFVVEPIHVTHSIVDAVALAIRTPVGTVFHTGDFKLDQIPIDGQPTDIGRIAEYGEEGILLLVSDSTNAISNGYSGSEADVEEALEAVFAKATGRILFTTFASHVHRIQVVVALAQIFERKVHFVGRSLINTVETAERLGHLHIPREVRADGNRDEIDDPDTVIICTGSQGEPSSALARIARDDHKDIQLQADDTVIFSARTIPGNERAVMHVIDHALRRGAEIVYEQPGTHVSGHGYREELKTMIRLTRPRMFIPIHGTLLHLVSHAKLARNMGIEEDNVLVITNGEVVEIDESGGRILEERVPAGKVFVDEEFEEVPRVVMRDRQHLGEDGFVIVVATVDVNTGRLSRDPEIITRGVVHVDASAEILDEIRRLLIEAVEKINPEELRDIENAQNVLRSVLRRYFRKKLGRRPMILPVVWEM